jgi:inner membrane protein
MTLDTLTHGLLGAAVANLGLRQRIGRDATWAAFLAAMMPDLDILAAPAMNLVGMGDSLNGLRIHRGITHSLLAVPVFALAMAGIWWSIRRKVRTRNGNGQATAPAPTTGETPVGLMGKMPMPQAVPRPTPFWLLYLCVFLPMLTHPLLDACTSYGTQLLGPIISARYAFDAVPIIDLLYTPILILTVLACYVVRKKTHSPAPRATFAIALIGLVLSCGYLCAGRYMHHVAVDKATRICQERHIATPEQIVRADAYPSMGSIFLWRALVETGDSWIVMRIHHLARDDSKIQPAVLPKTDNEWVRRARELPDVRTFEWFALGRVRAAYEHSACRHVVAFQDMRYGPVTGSSGGMWGFQVVYDDAGNLLDTNFEHRPRSGRGMTVANMWSDMWNP